MLFPLNTGVSESDVTATYTDRNGTNAKAKAFKNVSVNPTLYTAGLQEESDSTNPVASTIFTEIRKSPRKDGTVQTKIVGTTNKETTPSFKVKIYDSNFDDETVSNVATNLRATYHSSLNFPPNRVGFDIEDYDYFIILNHDIVDTKNGMGVDSVNAHFAKITRIVSFDEFGDGVEFSPKYNGEIPKGTKFEIYKGAAKTDTDLVAVSYGLRGDTSATTNKYDKICNVNTPTFYFYNDRLEEKDQLDYNEKYTVTSNRIWETTLSTISTSVINEHDVYAIGGGGRQIQFSTAKKANWDKLTEGMSLFNSSGTYIGNIESLGDDGGAIESRVYNARLDFARIAISASTDADLKIGHTIQNVVFKTEKKYDNTIQNKGRGLMDAVLVDNTLIDDEDDSSFDPLYWNKAFPLMKRSSTDAHSFSGNVWTESENLNGAMKYITFETASLKNDKIPTTLDTIVNNPKNKMSKIATVTTLDNSGTQHLKVTEDSKMVVRNGLFSDSMKLKKIEHKVSSSSNTITINGLTGEYDYSSILSDNTILEIDGYHYVVESVAARNYTLTTQTFTIDARKTVNSNVFVGGATVHTFTSADCYIVPYSNNKLNVEFAADTTVRHDQSDRLTLEDRTIEVENTKLYNSRLSITNRRGHDLRVNYGDKTHKYLTVLESTKQYYQKTPISRMYYYNGSFTLNEEIFNGNVEDIESKNENGMMTYTVSGRDDVAKLLTTTVNKNLNFSSDIIKSSLNPNLTLTQVTGTIDEIATSINSNTTNTTVTVSGDKTSLFTKYTLLFNTNKVLIGEVDNITHSSGTSTITLLDNSYISISNGTTYYYYNPFTTGNYLSLNKAMSSNKLMSLRPTTLEGASEKGIGIEQGFSFNQSLELEDISKNTLLQTEDKMGYDLHSINSISEFDSKFLFQLAEENEIYVNKAIKMIQSSNYMSVVDIIESETNKTSINVSPIFPVSLGLIDENSSDTRINSNHTKSASIYLLNTNLPRGGYIHKLDNTFNNFYTSNDIFRYIDLQSFNSGTINFNDSDSIYLDGKKPSKISGYTLAHNITFEGMDKDTSIVTNNNLIQNFTETGTTNTIRTSNVMVTDGQSNSATSNYWEMNALSTDTRFNASVLNNTFDDKVELFVQKDYRTRTYEFFVAGDLFPDSYLRYNHISYNGKSNQVVNYGMLWEGIGTNTDQISHSNYQGKTSSVSIQDKDYDTSSITESAITNTKDLRRWGIIRLVESTFDWHFNPIDSDSLKNRDEISKVPITQLSRFSDKESGVIWNNTNRPQSPLLLSSDDYLYSVGDAATYSSEGVNFTLAYFALPNLALTHRGEQYFAYNALKNGSNFGYDVHNVFLPIISKTFTNDGTSNTKAFVKSGVHYGIMGAPTGSVEGGANGSLYHRSAVLSGLSSPLLGNSNGIVTPHYYADFPSKTIYDNCVAVFRNIKNITSKDASNLYDFDSSSLLTIDNDYNNTNIDLSTNSQNQHSKNLLVRKGYNLGGQRHLPASFIGMKTENYPLINANKFLNINKISGDNDADTIHNEVSNDDEHGKIFAAQMLIKPRFNIVSGDYSSSPNVITRTMDSSSTHHWLHYMVDLTGQYIVGPNITARGTPSYIGKIISHTKKVVSNKWQHTITFDKDLSVVGTYRLMRISETTFDETPDFFEINVMDDSGLQHDKVFADFKTGGTEGTKSTDSEGVYSMQMLLEIDTTNTYLERRLFTNMGMFTDGEEIDCFISDGINEQKKSLSVTKTNTSLKFEYDGTITGNGCVSFGKINTITVPKKINIKPKKCFMGTIVNISSKINNAIEEIAKESGLDMNYEQSLKEYTTNLVDSVNGNVITCVNKPIGVDVNDVIYTQEGYLVGKVTVVSNTTITFDNIVFSPSSYDELIKRNNKIFISDAQFEDVDSFTAINHLASKRGLDYKISNGEIIAKNVEDVHSLRRFSISYKSGHNLISVESNKSLLDKANKIIVVGDGVKAESEIPTTKRTRTIRHVDSSIKSLSDAKIKATQLLEIHNADIRKIKLKIQKEGLELLEAGDILTLDFPNHDIPINDYQVFEIENILDGVSTITVGTFNKTIAERLGELSSKQTSSSFTLFGKNSVQSVVGKSVFDSFTIQNGTIEYKITRSSANLGFDSALGFDTLLGFGAGSTTLKTYKSEKDV